MRPWIHTTRWRRLFAWLLPLAAIEGFIVFAFVMAMEEAPPPPSAIPGAVVYSLIIAGLLTHIVLALGVLRLLAWPSLKLGFTVGSFHSAGGDEHVQLFLHPSLPNDGRQEELAQLAVKELAEMAEGFGFYPQ